MAAPARSRGAAWRDPLARPAGHHLPAGEHQRVRGRQREAHPPGASAVSPLGLVLLPPSHPRAQKQLLNPARALFIFKSAERSSAGRARHGDLRSREVRLQPAAAARTQQDQPGEAAARVPESLGHFSLFPSLFNNLTPQAEIKTSRRPMTRLWPAVRLVEPAGCVWAEVVFLGRIVP